MKSKKILNRELERLQRENFELLVQLEDIQNKLFKWQEENLYLRNEFGDKEKKQQDKIIELQKEIVELSEKNYELSKKLTNDTAGKIKEFIKELEHNIQVDKDDDEILISSVSCDYVIKRLKEINK